MKVFRLFYIISFLLTLLFSFNPTLVYAQEEELLPPEPEARQISQADLQLMERTLEFSAVAFKVGKSIKIAVKVKNTGTKKLAPVEVAFWVDEEMIGKAGVVALAPGEKQRLVIKWTPLIAGTYTVYAVADPHKRFEEIDEGNNRDSRVITIAN